jgi:hypothetical protein
MTDQPDANKHDEKSEDDDLSVEKEVAPEENLPGLPHPTPTDGGAPAP